MSIPVTEELVRHIARLARLGVSSSEEMEGFRRHFEKVLAYVEDLQAVDTGGVEATFLATASRNVFREDLERPSLPREEALRNAPQSDGVHFVVPRVVQGSSSTGAAAEAAEAARGDRDDEVSP